MNPFLEVTAITHRKDMIYVAWISQVTPSESSIIKKLAYEPSFLRFLQKECRCKSVTRVYMHEALTNLRKLIIIQMKKPAESEVWRALRAAASRHQGVGKIVIAVDEDIDPENMDAVWWAIAYRAKAAPRYGDHEGPGEGARAPVLLFRKRARTWSPTERKRPTIPACSSTPP